MSQLTKRAIKESFLKLLKEMPFDKITVKEIVEDCGINRNTFYYHYADIYDLLREIFEEKAEQVMRLDSGFDSWQEQFLNSTLYVLENRKSIYHIYNSMDRRQLENYLFNVAGKIMTEYVKKEARGMEVSEDDKAIIIEFYKCALAGNVLQWLDGGMKQDPEEFITRMAVLQEGAIQNMLKTAERKKES
ncbi:MAG: TetR-like C-terminal domain-containing protein [Eubacteriales bacterium]|nr:TetR-like C-terminal domain-containing protein [Eubacteriales bacterium]